MELRLNKIENSLVQQYKTIYERGRPDWAVKIAPSIPLVGNKMTSPRILAYGSAENLTYLNNPKKNPEINIKEIGEKNYYRYRYFLRHYTQNKDKFPYIHIQPINDGSLLTVTRYIAEREYPGRFSFNPFEFIEEISVANFGKYSIISGKNKDYAGNYAKLSESIDFIIADIRAIKPDLIIIPQTIFNTINKRQKKNWEYIKGVSNLSSTAKIVKIYQTNATVINCHIRNSGNFTVPNKSIQEFSNNWPVKESIPGFDIYLKWLDQTWNDRLRTA